MSFWKEGPDRLNDLIKSKGEKKKNKIFGTICFREKQGNQWLRTKELVSEKKNT